MKDDKDLSAVAAERAARYAPLPRMGMPLSAGSIGALVTALVIMTFRTLAGLDAESVNLAFNITVVIGFLVPFGYLKNQERLHYRARAKEYKILQEGHPPPARH